MAAISAAHHLCVMLCEIMNRFFPGVMFPRTACLGILYALVSFRRQYTEIHSVATYFLGRYERTSPQFGKRKKAEKRVTIVKRHKYCIECMCKWNAASSVLVIIISSTDRGVGQQGQLPQAPSVRGWHHFHCKSLKCKERTCNSLLWS